MHAQHKLINFFGLGSRSAVPFLYTYLAEHPNITLSNLETKFFSDTKEFAKGVAWYEGHFTKSSESNICGELAYDYLESAEAALLIARTYPSARLLAVIENPLVSVRVEYIEARRASKISSAVSLSEFLKDNPEVMLKARYGRQLLHYFGLYAPNDFLVLLASDISSDTLASLARAYEHIGLDNSFVPIGLKHLIPEEEEDIKRRPGIIKRTYRLVKKNIKRFFSYVNYVLNPPKAMVELASVVALKVPLSLELEQFLKDYYREDVKQLSALLHRNLSLEWGFSDEIKK